ncbi:ROK family protein [Paenibacillus sp. PAMC21692]|uniref:ROK family protein n=1 Tax=Paenibacillus sp. PAMC21692 TaxID=2762320 RepID=UPI00164CE55E|nr:ROK family protein [Paenibacillus sp. PAMC21692]QNK54913.1 ROK family protein [Paenibacillus sp. PAMC21692]
MTAQSSSHDAIVGVDIGGTNTVIGIFDAEGVLRLKRSIATIRGNPMRPTSNAVEFLERLSSEIVAMASEAGYRGIGAAGFGIPGWVEPGSGIALDSSNLGWRNVAFADDMSRRLDAPVFIDNDVKMYTLGEAAAGAGVGYRHLICLTLGTGLAAGIINDGVLVRGNRQLAGEFGHDVVDGTGYPCNCGKLGCLETIASASGIARLAEEAVRTGERTALGRLNRPITALDVYEACEAGDETALDIFRYVGRTLGRKLSTMALILAPEVFIVGGGVAAAGRYLMEPIREEMEIHLDQLDMRPELMAGKLGDSAGMMGATHVALERWRKESGRYSS